MRRVLPTALLGLLAAAPAAGAATLHVGTTGVVDYAAAPGEANALRASADGSVVSVRDDGATIVAGGGCAASSAHAATCTVTGLPRLSAQLGDGDDSATVTGLLSAVIDGGPGNDTLGGGDAPDVLEGGPGDDALTGGASDDTLYGDGPGLTPGGGDDRLAGGPGADVLDCGDGIDESDADGADTTDDCEGPLTAAPGSSAPQLAPVTAEPAATASPLDPGVIVPLTARSQAIVPVTLRLTAPAAITRSALRRTGLRVTVACSQRCRPTLALRRGTRTLTRRTVSAGTAPKAVRLKTRTTAGTLTLRVTAPDVTSRTRRVRVRG